MDAEQELVDEALNEGAKKPKKKEEEYTPSYQVIGDTKIPVSKSAGKLWKSRRDQALTKMREMGVTDAWEEAMRYYRNDQSGGPARNSRSRKAQAANRLDNEWTETENIVFANVSALVPAIYAKNPDAEITANKEDNLPLAKVCEKLVDTLAARKSGPGLHLKPKMRRAVVMAALTNVAFIEVGYTQKEQSSEQAMNDLVRLSEELTKAKKPKDIERIEGEISALEMKIDLLRPSGPWAKFRGPRDVLIDTDATEVDLSDANWVMVRDYVNTDFIQAQYAKKGEDGKYHSIYEPTHVMKLTKAEGDGHEQDQVNEFSLLPWQDSKFSAYGYSDEDTYKRACRTAVWYVWDRVTRRVYMFNDKDWSWPIWVWDDPYKLDTFFPLFPLAFYTDPEDLYARAEVSYYLDQQDAINEINSELRRIRQWARGKVVYNKNILKDVSAIEDLLSGTGDARTVGIDADPQIPVENLIHSMLPPSAEHVKYFDKKIHMEAINRLSGVPQVMWGVEYKTNTTNKAIESYESQMQTRLDEKMDAVEECIGAVLWAVAQMCFQFMPAEQVEQLIGIEYAKDWQNLTPTEIMNTYSVRVIGGSAIKPTSRAKKEQALQISQILGQFASATPFAILVMLKLVQRAFDEVQITEGEWEMLIKTIELQLRRGNSEQGGQPQEGGQQPQEGAMPEMLQRLEQALEQLPPEAKKAMGAMIAQGMPIREIITRLGGAGRRQ